MAVPVLPSLYLCPSPSLKEVRRSFERRTSRQQGRIGGRLLHCLQLEFQNFCHLLQQFERIATFTKPSHNTLSWHGGSGLVAQPVETIAEVSA